MEGRAHFEAWRGLYLLARALWRIAERNCGVQVGGAEQIGTPAHHVLAAGQPGKQVELAACGRGREGRHGGEGSRGAGSCWTRRDEGAGYGQEGRLVTEEGGTRHAELRRSSGSGKELWDYQATPLLPAEPFPRRRLRSSWQQGIPSSQQTARDRISLWTS